MFNFTEYKEIEFHGTSDRNALLSCILIAAHYPQVFDLNIAVMIHLVTNDVTI